MGFKSYGFYFAAEPSLNRLDDVTPKEQKRWEDELNIDVHSIMALRDKDPAKQPNEGNMALINAIWRTAAFALIVREEEQEMCKQLEPLLKAWLMILADELR